MWHFLLDSYLDLLLVHSFHLLANQHQESLHLLFFNIQLFSRVLLQSLSLFYWPCSLKKLYLLKNELREICNTLCHHSITQAKSFGSGLTGTLYLINPISLFRYSAVTRISMKGQFSLIFGDFYKTF